MIQVKEKLNEIKERFSKMDRAGEGVQDSAWFALVMPKKDWRKAKEIGCKKDYYYGWVYWSTSVNMNAGDLEVELLKVAVESGMSLRVRQL